MTVFFYILTKNIMSNPMSLLDYVKREDKELHRKFLEIWGKIARNKNVPQESSSTIWSIVALFNEAGALGNEQVSLASEKFPEAEQLSFADVLQSPSLYATLIAAQADEAYLNKWNTDSNYNKEKYYGKKVREARRNNNVAN